MSRHSAGLLHALAAVGGPVSADLIALAADRGLLAGNRDTDPTQPASADRIVRASCPPGLCDPVIDPATRVRALADLIGNPAHMSRAALTGVLDALDRHPDLAGPLVAVPALADTTADTAGWPTVRTLLMAAARSWSLSPHEQLEILSRFSVGPTDPTGIPGHLVTAPTAPPPWPPRADPPATGDQPGKWLVDLATNPTLHPDTVRALFSRYAGQPVTPLMSYALAELTVIYADGPSAGGRVRIRLLELADHLRTAPTDQLAPAVAPLLEGAGRRRALNVDLDPVEDGLLRAALSNRQLDAPTLSALLRCYDSGPAAAAALGCRPLPGNLLTAAALVAPAVLRGRQLDTDQVGELLRAAAAAPAAQREALVAALLEGDLLRDEHVPLLPWPVIAAGYAHRTPTVAVTVPTALYRHVEAALAGLLAAPAADVLAALHGLGESFTGTVGQFAAIAPAVVSCGIGV